LAPRAHACVVALPRKVNDGKPCSERQMDPIAAMSMALTGDDPGTLIYLVVIFVYSFLSAIVLPIPVEAILTDVWPLPEALALGLGKALGAFAIFYIGSTVEKVVYSWKRFGFFRWFLDKSEKFVKIAGIFAIYLLNSVPIMSDTVINYLFSILNKDGKLIDVRLFVLSNFLAGINRALLYIAVFSAIF